MLVAASLAVRSRKSNIYIYQKYAATDEEVFNGYGSEVRANLLDICRKYDPFPFLQTLHLSYFEGIMGFTLRAEKM
jgi:hypothetical protein